MPKKQKTPRKSAENRDGADNSVAVAKADVTAPVKLARKASKPAARKSSTPRKSRTTKPGAASHGREPSADQIQLRAYFISEQRHRHGTPGDHHSDWLEARRQLIVEAQKN